MSDTATTDTAAERTTGVMLTDAAAAKAAGLLRAEGRDDLALRIEVQPGGCAGLRYRLAFDDEQLEGDLVDHYDGVDLVVDRMSAPYLGGAVIDYADTIEQQGFTIDNPNAAGRPVVVIARTNRTSLAGQREHGIEAVHAVGDGDITDGCLSFARSWFW